VAGYNVNSIVVELPTTLLTSDGQVHPATDAKAVIGTYGTTSRPRIKAQPTTAGGKPSLSSNFVQIQRMGNPLINELLIGTGDKDKFSMSEPKNDSQFAGYLLDPLLARVLNAAYGGAVAIPTPPRLDLLPLVTYTAPICPGCTAAQAGPVADLLRLNTGIPATAKAIRKRLGVLAGDFGGFPNGRRLSDDATDIAARVVVGVLNPAFNVFPNNRIGDGVNSNDVAYQETFPYVAFANSGRNSRHQNPGTSGCVSTTPPFLPMLCPTELISGTLIATKTASPQQTGRRSPCPPFLKREDPHEPYFLHFPGIHRELVPRHGKRCGGALPPAIRRAGAGAPAIRSDRSHSSRVARAARGTRPTTA
jgi:hypothetical protein